MVDTRKKASGTPKTADARPTGMPTKSIDITKAAKAAQKFNTSKEKASASRAASSGKRKKQKAKTQLARTSNLRSLEQQLRFPELGADSSLLHLASQKSCPVEQVIEYLYEDVNQRGYYAQTPLHLSCLQPSPTLTCLLLEYGANPTLASTGGTTALHNSVAKGGAVQVACLLQNRHVPVDVDIEDGAGWRPLHLAAMCAADLATIDLLLGRKANVNVANWHMGGDTPLHIACRSHHACVATLLDAKADATAQIANGNTPLHLLVSHFSQQTKLPAIEPVKMPTLMDIAPEEAAHVAMIRHLLESKASADTRNKANMRPVDVAKSEYGKRLLGALVVELPDRWSRTFRLDTAKPLYKNA